MENAYDFKVLAAKLKDKGLDVAEELVKMMVVETIVWLDESAVASPNVYDDLGRPVLPLIKNEILKLADKIDGQVG